MAYSVRHITRFRYEPAVRESVMEVRLQPRTDMRQRCLSFSLDVTPRANIMVYRDFFGNAVHHFDIPGQHEVVEVAAQAIVEVLPPTPPLATYTCDWEELDERVAEGDYWEMLLPSHFARPTELLEKLRAELKLRRQGNPLELLQELNTALYESFEYAPNTTKVDSPIDDALEARRGVCQDFAHIMIALARHVRIPCRYVSGYVYRHSESQDRSPEAASHAWVEALLPGLGWVGFDPTNNLIAGERHIRTAIGRDYADVPPTKGIFKGDSESQLTVSVRVALSDAPPPPEEVLAPPEEWQTAIAAEQVEELQQQQQQQ
jgi:transglutaminase-like putative cysteine protease